IPCCKDNGNCPSCTLGVVPVASHALSRARWNRPPSAGPLSATLGDDEDRLRSAASDRQRARGGRRFGASRRGGHLSLVLRRPPVLLREGLWRPDRPLLPPV